MRKRDMLKGLTACAIAVLSSTLLPAIAATDFPVKPVTLIVPFPPGGPTDALARRLANGLKTQLGQNLK